MSQERIELIRAAFDAFNSGRCEVGLEGLADEVTWEVLDVFPERGPFHGREGIVRLWESWAKTFSEFRAEIEEVIDLEDEVIVVLHMSGRARGSEAPMRTPTFAQITTFKGDQIVHVRMVAGKDEALELGGATKRRDLRQRRSDAAKRRDLRQRRSDAAKRHP